MKTLSDITSQNIIGTMSAMIGKPVTRSSDYPEVTFVDCTGEPATVVDCSDVVTNDVATPGTA